MKKIGMFISLGLLSIAASANAAPGDLSLKLEPGLAIPTTDPQANRFGLGGDFAGRLQIALTSNLAVGPSISYLYLPPASNFTASGQAWSFGAGATLQRSHGDSNTGVGWTAVSPWVGADGQYARTGGLDRFGWSLGAGAAFPTSDSRSLWVGPFVKYQGVLQADKPGYDTNGAKIAIIGVSFEFGAGAKPKATPVESKEVNKEVPKDEVKPTPILPQPVTKPVRFEMKQTVQFPWNSSVLQSSQNQSLAEVTKVLLEGKDLDVKILGHASSEGNVEHNNSLSQNRAQAVLDYLVKQGVSRNRLSAIGFGSEFPKADNKTEAGRVTNRRVEFDVTFVIVKGGK